jgi:chromosomal replication initiator protein
VSDAQELWKSCSELLRVQVSEATWMTWFDELKAVTIVANTLVMAAPSSLVRERITGRYLPMVEDVVAEVAGCRLTLEVLVGAPTAGPVV